MARGSEFDPLESVDEAEGNEGLGFLIREFSGP